MATTTTAYGNSGNTQNIGYQIPQGGSMGLPPGSGGSGNSVIWDPQWQKAAAYNPSANDPFANSLTGGNGNANGGVGGAYGLQQFINSDADAQKQNQANWVSARDQLNQVPGQYNSLASTKGAQSLTNQLSANPLSLSPEIIQAMKNQTSNQISAQTDNALKSGMGALAAGGQDDASSIAALQSQLERQGMSEQQTQNTNTDIAAAKQRPIDLANAAGVAQKQSAQDIGVPYEVGNSIMSHLPQVQGMNPGILASIIAMAGMNNQNAIANSAATRPNSPGNTAGGKIGGDSAINPGGVAANNVSSRMPQGTIMMSPKSGSQNPDDPFNFNPFG